MKSYKVKDMSELHVVFGAGPLGKWTAHALAGMGKQVRVVNRTGAAERLPAGVDVVAGDAYDLNKAIEVSKGAATVYQCAQPPYSQWAERFPPLQKAILEAAAANGARLVVGDNLYMYGDPQGQPIREDMPYRAQTKKGKVRGEMARAVMDAHAAGKLRAAIGRASNFFGPEDHAVTDLAIRPAVNGKAINLLGRLDQPHTFSYVVDFGRLLATLGTREDAFGQICFAPSPPPVTQGEWVTMLAEELGRPIQVRLGGERLIRFLGLFNPLLRETVEMMYEYNRPFIVDTRKAEQAFGLQATPLRLALRETIAWVRRHPLG
jgi:nucleoside-diphosphate-sugar epimerase